MTVLGVFYTHLEGCMRLACVLSLVVMVGAAHADTWTPGQEITYSQEDWAVGGTAYTLLASQFQNVYPLSAVAVGQLVGGFAMIFDNPAAISSFFPASGPASALVTTLLNPASSPAGAFGGEVLALRLNVDFSDAGVTSGPGGPFGDLVIENVTSIAGVNGLTVRQVLSDANTALGGGVPPISIADLSAVITGLNSSFEGGTPSVFAQAFLVAPGSTSGGGTGGGTVPEPSSLILLVGGCLLMLSRRRQLQ